MSSVPMRKLELLVMDRDIDTVLEYLGESNCFQLAPGDGEGAGAGRDSADIAAGARLAEAQGRAADAAGGTDPSLEALAIRLGRMGKFLGLKDTGGIPPGTTRPDPELAAVAGRLADRSELMEAEMTALDAKIADLASARNEAGAFAGLSLPFGELGRMSFLSLRIGTMDPGKIDELSGEMGDRAMILPLDASGRIIAASSRKGRFALDSGLEHAGFVRQEFPDDYRGMPPEVTSALENADAVMRATRNGLEARRRAFAGECASAWAAALASVRIGLSLGKVRKGLRISGWLYRLAGWVPAGRVDGLVDGIEKRTSGRVAIRSFRPEELDSVASGMERVPVLLRHGKLVSAFEPMVLSYGVPLYGDLDPTPLVAFFFTLLFAVMFGDLGQGAVILLAGIAMGRATGGFLAKYRRYGPAFIAAGAGSMVMGLLVGSFFADETLLIPLERFLTAALTGKSMDRFLQVMPKDGIGSLLTFFTFTLGVGALINSVGLVANITNCLRRGRRAHALFGKTGLAGALLFWWSLSIAVRVAAGGRLAWFDLAGLGVPVIALFFSEPLGRLVEKPAEGEERPGLVDMLVSGVVEVIETVSYFASNTMSFLRVGAFALSHAVLSFVVFTMGDMLRTRMPFGIVMEILVFIVGNLVIIVLEGLIVVIQAVRLQYYEFFSKFFSETGTAFEPLGFGEKRSGSNG